MIDSERDLLRRELQELYGIERELEEFQARVGEEATNEQLRDFFAAHAEATTEQIARLEDLFDATEFERRARGSDALEGILAEREALVDDVGRPDLADLVAVETARAIERLEITKLETALELADRADADDGVVEPLRATKAEAENALERLEGMPTG